MTVLDDTLDAPMAGFILVIGAAFVQVPLNATPRIQHAAPYIMLAATTALGAIGLLLLGVGVGRCWSVKGVCKMDLPWGLRI